jgi:hypothetical protein
MPYGPIPAIKGLPAELSHEQKKALTAAAANYGCPLLYIDGQGERPPADFQARLIFTQADLDARYKALRPETATSTGSVQAVSLITIGCPQASVGELRAVAELLQRQAASAADPASGRQPAATLGFHQLGQCRHCRKDRSGPNYWRQRGALLLVHTCPEVVPYDKSVGQTYFDQFDEGRALHQVGAERHSDVGDAAGGLHRRGDRGVCD